VRPTGLCEEISVFLTRINLYYTYTIECAYSCVEPFGPSQGILAGNVGGPRGEARRGEGMVERVAAPPPPP
jgi:hypothetical protein